MIPSSLAGVAIAVLLLTPGFAYALRLERHVPARQYSVFRETARVLIASVAALTVAAIVLAAARGLWPHATLDIGALMEDPHRFIRVRHARLAWWGLAYVVLATALAVLAADPRVRTGTAKVGALPVVRTLTGSASDSITPHSAWYHAIRVRSPEGCTVFVGAQMDDGTYVQGHLVSFAVEPEDTEHREIVLQAPIKLRTADGDTHPLKIGYTVVSARHITRLDVTHLRRADGNQTPPSE